jgi:FtsH-binding integral membrane protein
MWVGFALSGATAVALLLTLCSRRRRGFDPLEGNHDDADTDEWETHTSSARSRFILSVSGLVIGSILVSPFWGALVAVSLLAIPAHRLTRYAIVSVSLGYGFVLAQQIRVDPQPGFGWPEAFHRAHRPMLAVIIVFVIAIHGSSTSRQSTLGSEHHSD